ncbi:hypothetical protein ABIE09_003643 [Lysobacter enzymogenes]|uniref:hypothetical protein n=1 Tax=Lysobacter enzymogenes TaxID=69 RepID=UPI003397FC2A
MSNGERKTRNEKREARKKGETCRQPSRSSQNVIPAKAGIQRLQSHASVKPLIPAFAGMTFW